MGEMYWYLNKRKFTATGYFAEENAGKEHDGVWKRAIGRRPYKIRFS
jgi:hypothetical protein